jgi:hypothetical protein
VRLIETTTDTSRGSVRIPGSRPGIMWTCIVRVTGIKSMMSEGEGIHHACGQFEHAIDSVNLARVKRKEKKRGKHGFRSISCSNKKDSSMMLSAV